MRNFVSEWEVSIFCSLSKVRQHKVETKHGWQQFAERVGPSGSRSYGDVCPTWFPPDQGYTELSQRMTLRVAI
jgi:hypothetical protein